ncbi:MAG: hypothetical protein BWY28_02425 [bacterium ADurb.Bin236]|nr:MAG: hypothetical protein BWY28_02425 [bacterium ADurb.Bin236]
MIGRENHNREKMNQAETNYHVKTDERNHDTHSFSFRSARCLFRYLGEIDALVELTELAARSFLHSAKQSDDVRAYVESLSKQLNICVNLSEVDCLSHHLARSYIVTVYQSAERFLHEFRGEHILLYGREWTGDRKDSDPLTVTLLNVASNRKEAEDKIGIDLITCFQYYRVVRNWIIHTKDSDLNKPLHAFCEIVKYLPEHKTLFGQTDAPNKPNELTFDDFILFSRLTKYIAKKLCEISYPPESYWKKSLLMQFNHLRNNPRRMKNALTGLLRTEYGMDKEIAARISNELCDSLA